jgi:hypothetical protein
MASLRVLDIPMTLSSIASATKLLDLLPLTVQSISLLQVFDNSFLKYCIFL